MHLINDSYQVALGNGKNEAREKAVSSKVMQPQHKQAMLLRFRVVEDGTRTEPLFGASATAPINSSPSVVQNPEC